MLAALSIVVLPPWSDPTGTSWRDRRRLRQVARDPRLAGVDDVETLVRAHGVPERQVWAVVDRLSGGGVDPTLAWAWTVDHDGNELAGLCASRLTDREVVAVLDGRRVALTAS